MNKDQSTPSSEDQILTEEHELLIELIKNKALKATLNAIQPLLDKLEEATKQQTQQETLQDQLVQLQNAALEKMKMQEAKIAEKMKRLQSNINKHI